MTDPAIATLRESTDADWDQRTINTLRDDCAALQRERDLYRLMLRAAMDQLTLVATAPERYEQVQRDLRKERESYMSEQFASACRTEGGR